jgi:hypothetical protein
MHVECVRGVVRALEKRGQGVEFKGDVCRVETLLFC